MSLRLKALLAVAGASAFAIGGVATAQPPAADKNCVAVFAASSGDLKQEQAHAGTRAAAVHFLKVSDC